MKKLVKIIVCLSMVVVCISYLLWSGNPISTEDEKYIQDYYHLNLKDDGYWWYRYHGKYVSTKSIKEKSVLTIKASNIELFGHDDEETYLSIFVSKNKINFTTYCLKFIDNLYIKKLPKKEVNFKSMNFNVEIYGEVGSDIYTYYSPIYAIYLNYEDVYYCFLVSADRHASLEYTYDQQDIDMDDLNICLEYIINSLD